jgi:hypothetical protein
MGGTVIAQYGRRARARLALCQAARKLSDQARALVPTAADDHHRAGQWVGDAAGLVDEARQVLELAVVAERQRGTSWENIAATLGISPEMAEGRFGPVERKWKAALRHPHVKPGGAVGFQLPESAHHPERYAQALDTWVLRHRERQDPGQDEHPVSGHLIPPQRRQTADGPGREGLRVSPHADRPGWRAKK